MRFTLLPILFLFLTTSCYTHRSLKSQAAYPATDFSYNQINGLYENVIPGDPDNSLWEDLFKNKSHKDITFNSYRTHIELELLNDKELLVKLYRKGTLEDSVKLRGRVVDNHFVVNRRIATFPLPFAFFFKENKTILGNDQEGNLVLTQGQSNSYVLLFTLTGGDNEVINARYARL